MIDFACKTFSLDEVIKCSLGLTKSDLKIMEFLIKHSGKFRSYEIAEKLGVSGSGVHYQLHKMLDSKILKVDEVKRYYLSGIEQIEKDILNEMKEKKLNKISIINELQKKYDLEKIEKAIKNLINRDWIEVENDYFKISPEGAKVFRNLLFL